MSNDGFAPRVVELCSIRPTVQAKHVDRAAAIHNRPLADVAVVGGVSARHKVDVLSGDIVRRL